jgi:hypothetical protein
MIDYEECGNATQGELVEEVPSAKVFIHHRFIHRRLSLRAAF